MAKWIEFIELFETGLKTKVWRVRNKDNGHNLGLVKWYAPFRQYSFFPGEQTVFERTCMRDIIAFIEEQHQLRREAKHVAAITRKA